MPISMNKGRLSSGVIAGAGALVFTSMAFLLYCRHLHVDELEILYSIQLCGSFGRPEFMLPVDLYEVALSTLAHWLSSSLAIFVAFRGLFWLGLLGMCAGIALVQQSLTAPRARAVAFLFIVLFGPLYRHGFEIRHDLIVGLSLVVLFWACERARAGRLTRASIAVAAATTVIAQANSIKAFTVCVPALGLCLWLDAYHGKGSRRPLLISTLRIWPGILAGAAIAAILLASAGALKPHFDQTLHAIRFSAHAPFRLSQLPLYAYIGSHSPLHALLFVLGLWVLLRRLYLRQPLAEALVPACFLCFTVLSATLNPTLFPYNLTWMTPSILWVAVLGLAEADRQLRHLNFQCRFAAAALALLCGVGSLISTSREQYFRTSWQTQRQVIAAAESLTPSNVPVLDLTGLVISRPPVSRDWLVHSLLMPDYRSGRRESIRSIISRVWPAVVVANHYRWGFVDAADRRAVALNYVSLTHHVWVLGHRVQPGTRSIEVHRTGKYQVRAIVTQEVLGLVDERPVISGTTLELSSGSHSVHSESIPWQLEWRGPSPISQFEEVTSPLFESAELPGQL